MGKTYKDQRKWEQKKREREGAGAPPKKYRAPRHERFASEDDEPLDKWEDLAREWGEDE